jgi:lipopolysaccharide biosynthesis glycosyltransferase
MFATVCNKEYLIGFEVMLKSLIENNPRIKEEKLPFVIISNDLQESNLETSKKIYSNIILHKFDEEKYVQINELKKQRKAFGDYSKYEVFGLTEYNFEKIIFLDSDTLILGNIDYLIDYDLEIGMVRELFIDQYNTGVMVINSNYLNNKIVDDLIELTIRFGITEHLDQDIINHYFVDKISEIPMSYNFLKIYEKQIFANYGIPKNVKILHYVVKKPWQNKPIVFLEEGTLWTERYWFEYYAKIMKLKI